MFCKFKSDLNVAQNTRSFLHIQEGLGTRPDLIVLSYRDESLGMRLQSMVLNSLNTHSIDSRRLSQQWLCRKRLVWRSQTQAQYEGLVASLYCNLYPLQKYCSLIRLQNVQLQHTDIRWKRQTSLFMRICQTWRCSSLIPRRLGTRLAL